MGLELLYIFTCLIISPIPKMIVEIVDNIERMESNIYDDIIKYNKVIDNRIELIRKMEFKKLTKLLDDIDLSNISILKVLSKEKSD